MWNFVDTYIYFFFLSFLPSHRELRTDTLSSISKRPKGSESPNSYLDKESRRRCTIGDYDKMSAGCPIEANVIQPKMREHKHSRGQRPPLCCQILKML